ncbi:MAG: carbamoyltransferase C-terminal domain-containing protein [Acidobacteriota bacterium]
MTRGSGVRKIEGCGDEKLRIIGVSGLEHSIPFKRRHWPGLSEREYRISQGHDAAAVLVQDGEIVAAAAEERFCGRKHTGEFPVNALMYCLAEAGISIDQIDAIVHAFDYSPFAELYSLDPVSTALYTEVLSNESFLRTVHAKLPQFPAQRVYHIDHHLSHAASAFFTSGWDEALVIVLDAMGESQSISVYHAHDGVLDKLREVSLADSLGVLYSLITLHLGFDFNSDEYKIMGLAPYGDAKQFQPFFDGAVHLLQDGTVRIPMLHLNQTREERENYSATRRYLETHLCPARAPEAPLADIHRDVAAALQQCLNRSLEHICITFAARTGLRRLALAGGVALNCTANGHLMRCTAWDEIYIQPAAGDDGAALGAALFAASALDRVCNRRMPPPFLGPEYSSAQIEAAIGEFNGLHVTRFANLKETCKATARLIADGRVLAWFRGRMEFGPRALGHRSILADPRDLRMRDRINAMVKKREAFRPFAPAVSVEQVHQWFEVSPSTKLPYMVATAGVRAEYRTQLPAVTHVDGSARVQTVSQEEDPDFHALLSAVGKETGREVILNTSFNVRGQPMVNTPQEALSTFLNTGIDFLVMENMLIAKVSPQDWD